MPISDPEPLLHVTGLSAGYGNISVLNGIDLTVGAGEIVALLGPNGAGKTTLLKAISGLLPRTGQIRFAGQDMGGAGPRDTVRAGLVHVVEGHRVFNSLTVFDNLLLAGYGMPRRELAVRVEEALAFFPEIAAKRADRAVTLSGGQAQMLAVAQGLVRRPRLLMLDEPSAGLSPVLVDRVLAVMESCAKTARPCCWSNSLLKKHWRLLTASMRSHAARSCWKPRPAKPTCPSGWNTPISARMLVAPLS